MSPGYKWIPTNYEVFDAIYMKHKEDLMVFASCTNTESNSWLGERQIMTEYGFRNASVPLIKIKERGEVGEQTVAYWIALVECEE